MMYKVSEFVIGNDDSLLRLFFFSSLLSYTFRDQMWTRRLKSVAILLAGLLFFSSVNMGIFFFRAG